MDKIKRKIYLDKIIEVMKNDFPLFHNLKLYGFRDQLSGDELYYVLSGIFEHPIQIEISVDCYHIFDNNDNELYYENYGGIWRKTEYDEYGNEIYMKDNYISEWLEIWKKEYDDYHNNR